MKKPNDPNNATYKPAGWRQSPRRAIVYAHTPLVTHVSTVSISNVETTGAAKSCESGKLGFPLRSRVQRPSPIVVSGRLLELH